MIRRIDRIQVELPPPSDPDPAGAAAVQELLGGKFGEESGHVELVAKTINTMLTGATPTTTPNGRGPGNPLEPMLGIGNPHHFLAGGQGALPQNSQGRPWNGDYVFSSGDIVEDLTHNFFLETGARNGKLKVYEMVEHPAARALTGYLLVRGGVHQVAYARALERLTGADLMKLFPSPRIPTEKIPECRAHIKRGEHLRLYRFSPSDYLELAAVFKGPHPETGEELEVVEEAPEGVPAYDLPAQPAVFAPDYAPEEIAAIAAKLRKQAGLPKAPTGETADGDASKSKPRPSRRAKTTAKK